MYFGAQHWPRYTSDLLSPVQDRLWMPKTRPGSSSPPRQLACAPVHRLITRIWPATVPAEVGAPVTARAAASGEPSGETRKPPTPSNEFCPVIRPPLTGTGAVAPPDAVSWNRYTH